MKYKLEERLIWFKGELVPIKEARVMAFSPSFQFGLNVFEGIPCYWNNHERVLYAFRLNDHYRRLFRSAKLLDLKLDFTIEDFKNALNDVVIANDICEDVSIRQTIFIDDFGSWSSSEPTDMFVVATPRRFNNSEYNKSGLTVCISSWRRISENTLSPRIKCGANYINSRVGQREALRNGYDTCIFLNDAGKIAEGPGSCLFIIKNKTLITPLVTDSVLESITRDTVIKIAKKIGYSVIERTVDRSEVYMADEAFLCGSAMEITSITKIDQYNISDCEGLITKEIHDMYKEIVRGSNPYFTQWVTAIN